MKTSTVRQLPAPVSGGGRRAAAGAGGGLLPRDAEAEPGGAGVPGGPRAAVVGDDRPLPARASPTGRWGCGCLEQNRKAGGEIRGRLAAARGAARERARAPERVGGDSDLRRGRQRRRDVRAEDHARDCGRERRCTCTCPARTAASSTGKRLRASKTIILCEALIDALTFWCHGFRNVTSVYGIEVFTRAPGRLQALREHAGADRFRSRRGRRPWRGEGGGDAHDGGHLLLPGAIPSGHGRERVRAAR